MTSQPPRKRVQWHHVNVSGLKPCSKALLHLSRLEPDTQLQRRVVSAYGRAVVEIARAVGELEKLNATKQAESLAGYASQVTNMACEHLAQVIEMERAKGLPQ